MKLMPKMKTTKKMKTTRKIKRTLKTNTIPKMKTEDLINKGNLKVKDDLIYRVSGKKVYLFKPIYLRPLILLRNSSVLEMNLWISSFKNTNSKFYRIFVFRDIQGRRYYSRFSGYIWPTFDNSEITSYFKIACILPKMVLIQV